MDHYREPVICNRRSGTWLGITRDGRFAALTNVRESDPDSVVGTTSRGAVVSSFLSAPKPVSDSWMEDHSENMASGSRPDIRTVGGFSMMCGKLSRNFTGVQVLRSAITSNRAVNSSQHDQHTITLSTASTEGLSNSLFNDPWQKVLFGRKLLRELAAKIIELELSENKIIKESLSILSIDSLSRYSTQVGQSPRLEMLQNSIFIPQLSPTTGGEHSEAGGINLAIGDTVHEIPSPYGTQKQTIIIVRDTGQARYVERSLYKAGPTPLLRESSIIDMIIEFELD